MSSSNERIRKDVAKLIATRKNEGDVCVNEKNFYEINVKFYGPKDSYYKNGVWKVSVELPRDYPAQGPKLRFCNKIFHPNIGHLTGIVCLDVLNELWQPEIDLYQIFEYYLPGLLIEPNKDDSMNGAASNLLNKNPESFQRKIFEFIQNYATEEIFNQNFDLNQFDRSELKFGTWNPE